MHTIEKTCGNTLDFSNKCKCALDIQKNKCNHRKTNVFIEK
jgi:hypothetical protein